MKAISTAFFTDRKLRAPGDIKIDGKATEWNNRFQAYNHAAEIFYTLANDDKNIYLAIRAKEPEVVTRIAGGGVTFTVNTFGQKKDKNGVSITYPFSNAKNPPLFILKDRERLSDTENEQLITRYNRTLDQYFEMIRIDGIPHLDKLISIYNEDGIKAAGLFDHLRAYNLEIAVPLKYLSGQLANGTKFTYHIVINGRNVSSLLGEALPGQPTPRIVERGNQQFLKLSAPTDF